MRAYGVAPTFGCVAKDSVGRMGSESLVRSSGAVVSSWGGMERRGS